MGFEQVCFCSKIELNIQQSLIIRRQLNLTEIHLCQKNRRTLNKQGAFQVYIKENRWHKQKIFAFNSIFFSNILYIFAENMRISLQWYRRSGELVPRGADAWYRLQRSDGTDTKRPLHTLSKGAMQTVLQGTLSQRDWMVLFASSIMAQCLT